MFDWLFPNWSSPVTVAAIVALRLLVDTGLVAAVARSTQPRSRPTAAAAALTFVSTLLMVSVLRPGGAGRTGSYVEIGLQFVLLGVAGYATYENPSTRRWATFAALAGGAILLLLPAIVLYGEATVAP